VKKSRWLASHRLMYALLLAFLGANLFWNARAELVTLPEGGETEVSLSEIHANDHRVKIAVTERSLKSILQAIQNISDISFELTNDLASEPITAVIESPNWSDAVRELLKSFNRVEIFNEKQALKKVFVLRRSAEGISENPDKIRQIDEATAPPLPPPPPLDDVSTDASDDEAPPADVQTPPDDFQGPLEQSQVTGSGPYPADVPAPPPPPPVD
jgi:hypothetical protein